MTGGGRGLGRVVSLTLGEAGANVVVGYLRHQDPAREVVEAIERAGGAAVAVMGDVSRDEDVDRLVTTAGERFGGAQIFVSNAALGVFGEPADLRRRAVGRTLEIGAWPLLDISRRLFGFFEQSRYGRIIAVSSVGSRRAIPHYAALAMAKGAAEALTRYLAEYVGRNFENVTANAVVPSGFHDGNLPAHVGDAELAERIARETARTPGGRMPTMDEVAGAVLFLASELGAGVNGHELVVDRGWLIT